MTAILDGGRSFPFVENLITQTDNAKEYQGVSKKLTICNHSNPPFRGKGFPRKGGLTACLLCSAPFRPQPLSLGLSIIRDALRFVKFCRSVEQRLYAGTFSATVYGFVAAICHCHKFPSTIGDAIPVIYFL